MGLRKQTTGNTIELIFTNQRSAKLNVIRLIRGERITNREVLETRIEEILTPQLEEGTEIQIAVRSVAPLHYAMKIYTWQPELAEYNERTGEIDVRPLARPNREDIRDND